MMRALLWITMLLWSGVAVAQQSDDERARMHFQSGLSYYEQARYEDAAREFKQAYNLSQRPALLLNLSQAYERDLKFTEAIAELERYLGAVPDSPQRVTVETRIERLRALQGRMAQQPTGTPDPAPTDTPAADPVATPEPSPDPASTPPTTTAPASGGGISVPGIILVSAGGALLVGSLITGLMANGTHSDLQDRCTNGVCPPDAQDDIDSGKTMAWVSTGMMAGGVIAAAIGAVLLITHKGQPDQAPAASVTIGPGQLGAAALLRF